MRYLSKTLHAATMADASQKYCPSVADALLVVDVQYDFLPGGALAVPHGDQIIPVINELAANFKSVVLTQDWHPKGHISFASSHPGTHPHDEIDVAYGRQVLWPDHCVQDSQGAALSTDLHIPHARLILRKGIRREVDSYSAFLGADRVSKTGLAGYLNELGIKNLFIAGLATDFCVACTAMDAIDAGFTATVVEDAAHAIDINGSLAAAWESMLNHGVKKKYANDFMADHAALQS